MLIIGRYLWIALVLSCASLPFFNISGVTLPVIFSLLLMLFFCLNALYGQVENAPVSLMFLAAILLAFLISYTFSCLLGSFYSRGKVDMKGIGELYLYSSLFLGSLFLHYNNKSLITESVRIIGGIGVLLATYGLYRFFTLHGAWLAFTDHLSTGIGTKNSDVVFLWPSVAIWATVALSKYRSVRVKLMAALFLLIVLSAVILSASRGASLIAFVLLLSITFASVSSRSVKILLVMSIVSFSALLFFVFPETLDGLYLFERIVSKLNQEEDRSLLLSMGLSIIADHPIGGSGSQVASQAVASVGEVHFHNAFIQLGVENGLFNVFLFLLVFLSPIMFGLEKLKLQFNEYRLIGVAICLGIIMEMMISIFYNWIFIWVLFSIGCSCFYYHKPIFIKEGNYQIRKRSLNRH